MKFKETLLACRGFAVDLLPPVKKWLRTLSPGRATMSVSLVVCLAVLLWPQNRGSLWQSVSGLTFSPDGKRVAIGVYSGRFRSLRERWYFSDIYQTIALADPANVADAVVLGRESRPDVFNILPEVFIGPSVAFSADSSTLVSAGFNGALSFWDVPSGRRLSSLSIEQLHLRTLASLAQGDRFAAAFREYVYLGSFSDNMPARTLQVGPNILALAPAPDGYRFAIGGLGSLEIEIWNASDGKLVKRFEGPVPPDTGDLPPRVTALAWLPDGKSLVAANDKTVEIIEVTSGNVIAVLPERLVLSLAVSPDGKQLATGRFDGVTIWDLRERKKTAIHLTVPAVESVQFSPDGSRLAAGSSDGTVRTWNLPNYSFTESWTFPRPNDVGLGQFLRLFPLLVWIGVWIYLRRSRRTSREEVLPRV
jgi:WD40 repeat protein